MKHSKLNYSLAVVISTLLAPLNLSWAQTSMQQEADARLRASAPNHSQAGPVANPETQKSIQQAVLLYEQKQYLKSRDLLEEILQKENSSVYVCYYAALANRACGCEARAEVLCKYITETFPTTTEAEFAKQMLSKPNESSNLNATKAEAKLQQRNSKSSVESIDRHPFTAADIAVDGPNGVDQGSLPNCWFESGLAALAALPRGQAMIANTITKGEANNYIVTFNDGSNYNVTEKNLKECRDHALWARIIESAERKKYPNSKPDTGPDKLFAGSLEAGMGLITGRRGEPAYPGKLSEEEVAQFIYAAVRSQNPIVAATKNEHCPGIKNFVIPGHVYSIIDFDSSKHMVVLRNPWGSNPKNIRGDNDHLHLAFEAREKGVIRLSLNQFRKYFWVMSRSFI